MRILFILVVLVVAVGIVLVLLRRNPAVGRGPSAEHRRDAARERQRREGQRGDDDLPPTHEP